MTTGAPSVSTPATREPRPLPEFEVIGAAPVPHTASPTLCFRLRGRDTSGLEIFTIALSVQVQLEPAMRTHDPETRARLVDLFGDPERWSTSTKSLVWGRLGALVPSFREGIEFDLPAPLTYDLDLGVAKYLHALDQGEVPLTFHFSGTVVYRDAADRVQIVQVPWAQSTFRMPVAAWRATIDQHYPGRGWVGVRQDTLARLQRYKTAQGLLTLDDGLAVLLDAAEDARRDA